jgi:RNA polymerase sigma-70 factor, ECF subfamily
MNSVQDVVGESRVARAHRHSRLAPEEIQNYASAYGGDTERANNFHRAGGSSFMDDPDIDILRAVAGGDHLAFKRLVERYQSRLFNFLYRYLRDREAAEDLTQEVFLKVYRAAPRFEPRAKVRTWIFTIAYNLAVNELRRRQRRGFFGLFVPEDREGVTMEAPEAGDRLELAETMTKALSLLPDNQKAALLLRVRDELSYQEIGEILGVSRSSVESLLFRARERLRRLLRGREAR